MQKIIISILLICALASCAPTKESMLQLKPDEVTSVMKLHVAMDGYADSGGLLHNVCMADFLDKDGKLIRAQRDSSTGYYVMKTPAGKVSLARISCMQYEVLFNKIRQRSFRNWSFQAQPGYINYAGDVHIAWASDSVGVEDIILGGQSGEDQGSIHFNLQDHMDIAQQFMMKEYNTGERPFKASFLTNSFDQ